MDKDTYFYGKAEEENNKIYTKYMTNIIDNSSISIDLFEDLQTGKKKGIVLFRSHKGNGKIRGEYLMRLFKTDDMPITLEYIDRKGFHSMDFSGFLTMYNEDIRLKLQEGILTYEMLEDLIRMAIQVINIRALGKSDPSISNRFNLNLKQYGILQEDASEFIKKQKVKRK